MLDPILEKLQSSHVGHVEIAYDDIRTGTLERALAVVVRVERAETRIGVGQDLAPSTLQKRGKHGPKRAIIFKDENPRSQFSPL